MQRAELFYLNIFIILYKTCNINYHVLYYLSSVQSVMNLNPFNFLYIYFNICIYCSFITCNINVIKYLTRHRAVCNNHH